MIAKSESFFCQAPVNWSCEKRVGYGKHEIVESYQYCWSTESSFDDGDHGGEVAIGYSVD